MCLYRDHCIFTNTTLHTHSVDIIKNIVDTCTYIKSECQSIICYSVICSC